ncbi:MAG: hypothetical protein IKG58_02780 [Bacilli bacterium]|nr:hypothetical protein [Bacilli bacterium]
MANKKKNNKKKVNKKEMEVVNTTVKEEFHKIIRLLCVVLIVLGIFFLLTTYITNKKTKTNKKNDDVEIGYQEILLGNSFNVSDGEYLVLYYDMSNSDLNSKMSTLINDYESKNLPLYIYTVNMSNRFNKKYASSESNSNPTKVSELSIAGPTLIKFTDRTVDEYIEGYDSIKEYLK